MLLSQEKVDWGRDGGRGWRRQTSHLDSDIGLPAPRAGLCGGGVRDSRLLCVWYLIHIYIFFGSVFVRFSRPGPGVNALSVPQLLGCTHGRFGSLVPPACFSMQCVFLGCSSQLERSPLCILLWASNSTTDKAYPLVPAHAQHPFGCSPTRPTPKKGFCPRVNLEDGPACPPPPADLAPRAQLGGGLPVYLTDIRHLTDGRITFRIGYDYQ